VERHAGCWLGGVGAIRSVVRVWIRKGKGGEEALVARAWARDAGTMLQTFSRRA
jgi:hypothetical protein